MAQIVEIRNPFEPSRQRHLHKIEDGKTFRDWMDSQLGEGVDFEFPTLAVLNGEPMLRDSWQTYRLGEDDIVTVQPLVGDPVQIALLVLSIASVAYTLSIDIPSINSDDDADPVYFLSGKRNQIKIGSAIECPYGKNKLYPSYAARSYTKFKDNDQELFQLFCLGQGEYTIHDEFIGDTDLSSYSDITTEVYGPNDDVTLFPDNVVTSGDVAGIELLRPEETGAANPYGPFNANAAGTTTDSLEVDLVFPRGLYMVDDQGRYNNLSVTILFEYREIDDAGSPLGSWTTLSNPTINLNTRTIQRFTYEKAVTAGRYEVRASRTSNNPTDNRNQYIGNAEWFQLRAILPSTKDYGDVTLVAMRAKATNNLNEQSKNRYSLTATRKLPIWNGSSFDAAAATRNPVWAFVDVLRATYGGNLPNENIDLAGLLTLATAYDTDGITFDWVFDKQVTIWKALKTIATAARAAPTINLTEFSMVRDEVRNTPVMAFSPDSMIAGSLKWDTELQKSNDYDGILIEYEDEDTYQQETVECLFGSDTGTNLQTVRLAGVKDRDRAFREGKYIRAKQVLQREVVQFQTGLEGMIPSFGDYIVVGHDVPRWSGQTGWVVSITSGDTVVTVTENLNEVDINSIAFRDKYGAVKGPYSCTKTGQYEITTDSAIDVTDFTFDDISDPPAFFAGVNGVEYKELIVTAVKTNEDVSTITAINYDPLIYQFDGLTATALGGDQVPDGIPDLPTITGLRILQDISSLSATINWDIAEGAQYYILQQSLDGTNWDFLVTTTGPEHTMLVTEGTLYIRVAGVNSAKGPWTDGSASVGFDRRITTAGDTRVDSSGNRRITVGPST